MCPLFSDKVFPDIIITWIIQIYIFSATLATQNHYEPGKGLKCKRNKFNVPRNLESLCFDYMYADFCPRKADNSLRTTQTALQ